MKKTFLSLAAATAIGTAAATAGINSGDPRGYLDRGVAFYDAGVNHAALDQLTHFNLTADPTEQSRLYEALAAARFPEHILREMAYAEGTSIPYLNVISMPHRAIRLLDDFLRDYPAFPGRAYIYAAMGDIAFQTAAIGIDDDWKSAYVYYSLVPEKALDPATDRSVRACQATVALNLYVIGDRSNERYLDDARRLADGLSGPEGDFINGYIAYLTGNYSEARRLFNAAGDPSRTDFYLMQIDWADNPTGPALEQARRYASDTNLLPSFSMEANRMTGEALFNMGDHRAAELFLKNYVNRNYRCTGTAKYMYGICLYENSDYQLVTSYLNSFVGNAGAPRDLVQSALLTLGQAYYHLDEMQEAALALDKAVKMDADPAVTEQAMYDYMVVRAEGGRMPFDKTADIYEEFLRRFPASEYAPAVASQIVRGYLSDHNYKGVIAAVDRVKSPTPELMQARQQALYALGVESLADGRPKEALDYLTQARSMKQYSAAIAVECDYLIGECQYATGDYRGATKSYESYLAGTRGDSEAPNRATALYNTGYALFSSGKYADAKSYFDKYLLDPGDTPTTMQADAANRLGDCLYYAGQLQQALRAYDKGARLNPAAADYASYQRAMILGYQGNLSDKIKALNEFCRQYSSSTLVPEALIELAATQRQAGRDADAIDTYRTIERRYPKSPYGRRALYLMSAMQAASGQTDAAFDAYRKLITDHSPSEEATAAAESFKELAVQEGRLDEYFDFMSTSPNAPKMTTDEMDDLTYRSAKTSRQLEQYLEKYPRGNHAPEALVTLIRDASKKGNNERLLSLSTRLVTDFPACDFAPEAWQLKADAELSAGMMPEALESYRALEECTRNAAMLLSARMGQIRAAAALDMNEEVIALAKKILDLGSGENYDEVIFLQAMARRNLGDVDEAAETWRVLSTRPQGIYGAMGAYYLAEYYFDKGRPEDAMKTLNKFIESDTPHSYWLARGYILLSDIYRSQGDTFEADEYLKVLRENYPGTEPDIFEMIETRLAK